MSKITTILNELKARIQLELPSHAQLTNPYNVGANTEMALKKGFGIAVGPGDNTNRNLSCKLSVNRSILIKLTTKFYATDLNVDAKEAAEKDLLESQFLIIKSMEKEPTLNGNLATSGFVSDSGILRVYDDKDQFLKLESVFNFEYMEDLN